jgi:hypothetical protein
MRGKVVGHDIQDKPLKRFGRKFLPFIPISLKRQAIYYYHFRRFIPTRPRAFYDKINWRMLHDRRDIIAKGGDKIWMKKHAFESHTSALIPETLWTGPSIGPILDIQWPGKWVLKPRVGSGYVAFGAGSLRESGITEDVVNAWRPMDHFHVHGVWGYGQGEAGYLIERLIETADESTPDDYKFFVFDGQVRLVQYDSSRYEGHQRRYYTPKWEALQANTGRTKLAPTMSPPPHLDSMIEIAEAIGKGYDFIRVDLYDTPDGVYFGEITPYPHGGLEPFDDRVLNFTVGDWWALPPKRSLGKRCLVRSSAHVALRK